MDGTGTRHGGYSLGRGFATAIRAGRTFVSRRQINGHDSGWQRWKHGVISNHGGNPGDNHGRDRRVGGDEVERLLRGAIQHGPYWRCGVEPVRWRDFQRIKRRDCP